MMMNVQLNTFMFHSSSFSKHNYISFCFNIEKQDFAIGAISSMMFIYFF